MSVVLAASSDERAAAIWKHLLGLVDRHGVLDEDSGASPLRTLTLGAWTINHWLPPVEVAADEAASPGYRDALERQRARSDLPYGLEVWRGLKVLSVLWSTDGDFKVVDFLRGDWEAEALALGAPAADEPDEEIPV